jgi:hypothetical protein
MIGTRLMMKPYLAFDEKVGRGDECALKVLAILLQEVIIDS